MRNEVTASRGSGCRNGLAGGPLALALTLVATLQGTGCRGEKGGPSTGPARADAGKATVDGGQPARDGGGEAGYAWFVPDGGPRTAFSNGAPYTLPDASRLNPDGPGAEAARPEAGISDAAARADAGVPDARPNTAPPADCGRCGPGTYCSPATRRCEAPIVVMSFTFTHSCMTEAGPIAMRFFDETNGLIYPNATDRYLLPKDGTETFTILCVPGARICFGGAAVGGRAGWGTGLQAERSCVGCCGACGAGDVMLTLVCR